MQVTDRPQPSVIYIAASFLFFVSSLYEIIRIGLFVSLTPTPVTASGGPYLQIVSIIFNTLPALLALVAVFHTTRVKDGGLRTVEGVGSGVAYNPAPGFGFQGQQPMAQPVHAEPARRLPGRLLPPGRPAAGVAAAGVLLRAAGPAASGPAGAAAGRTIASRAGAVARVGGGADRAREPSHQVLKSAMMKGRCCSVGLSWIWGRCPNRIEDILQLRIDFLSLSTLFFVL